MNRILLGDSIDTLKTLSGRSADCCVTSPPYYGLRDYGADGQIGLEKTPEAYIQRLVEVFREVRRVLRDDGTLWVNIGDSYAGSGKGGNPTCGKQATNQGNQTIGTLYGKTAENLDRCKKANVTRKTFEGIKAKDLIGIPWMLAFALRADGWHLRQDIIWHKPNAMPESVKDRCTKSHEHIFLLSKSSKYYFDGDSIKEPSEGRTKGAASSFKRGDSKRGLSICPNSPMPTHRPNRPPVFYDGEYRNRRSVWTVAVKPYKGAHFATFPPGLVLPCILAGSREGGTVLDPFIGSGTTAVVAIKSQRRYIGCEINQGYVKIAERRICAYGRLFNT